MGGITGRRFASIWAVRASVKLSSEERATQPHAGAVFRARPGFVGRPPNRFKG